MTIKNQRGFSLIEIMIVLAIIGLIAGVMGSKFTGVFGKAKAKNTKILFGRISDALEMYNTDCNTYPSTDQGLDALKSAPDGEPSCEAWGPTTYWQKKDFKDSWGRQIIYESDGIEFELRSLGADKREGGEALNADISSADD